jgi:hypothetical protein
MVERRRDSILLFRRSRRWHRQIGPNAVGLEHVAHPSLTCVQHARAPVRRKDSIPSRTFCAPTLGRLLTINHPVGSKWNGVAPRSRTRFNRKPAQKRPDLLNALSGY